MPPTPSPRPSTPLDSETWIGQRGLLAVGVFALLLAAGYLLKLSFERGWVSPVMRCATGALTGAGVAALGWRLVPRSRRYGTSLLGAGAGVMYLAVWAACKLYGLVLPTPGIAALALIALSLAAVAYALNAERLAFVAAFGAFFAPILLGSDRQNADALILYLGAVGLGLGIVAVRRRWRATVGLLAVGALVLGMIAAGHASPWLVLVYGTLVGIAGLSVALTRGWWETRVVAFSGGWGYIVVAAERMPSAWPVLAAALCFAVPVWLYALRHDEQWVDRIASDEGSLRHVTELLYFLVLPFGLLWAIRLQAPGYFDTHPGRSQLLLAVPYLAAGLQRPRVFFSIVGTGLLLWGVYEGIHGIAAVYGLAAVCVAWHLGGRLLQRRDAAWLALAAFAVTLLRLTEEADVRAAGDTAFLGLWPVACWAVVIVGAVLAATWERREGRSPRDLVRGGLWLLLGGIVLGVVTNEIDRAWVASSLPAGEARLASGLTVSAWWLAAATVLVVTGFRRDWKPVRMAGLLVALVAVGKVLLVDLSSLDALWRVASVAILALVSLSLAWLYNRRGRPAAAVPGAPGPVDAPPVDG